MYAHELVRLFHVTMWFLNLNVKMSTACLLVGVSAIAGGQYSLMLMLNNFKKMFFWILCRVLSNCFFFLRDTKIIQRTYTKSTVHQRWRPGWTDDVPLSSILDKVPPLESVMITINQRKDLNRTPDREDCGCSREMAKEVIYNQSRKFQKENSKFKEAFPATKLLV